MLTQNDVERRLVAGLCFPSALAEGLRPEPRKWAFASAVTAFDKAGARHAIAGELCLYVRGVAVERCQLEFAVDRVPRAELEAESFVVEGDTCRRQGIEIRLRVVKPAVLGRAERFGKLALLGAADVLRGMVEDACSPGISSTVRATKIAEAERLSLALPDAALEVNAKLLLSRAAKANDNGRPEGKTMPTGQGEKRAPTVAGQGTAQAAIGQEIYKLVGKIFGWSVLVLALASMPACQLDASGLGSQTLGPQDLGSQDLGGSVGVDGSTQPKQGSAGQDGGAGEAGSDVRGQGAETSRDQRQRAEAGRDTANGGHAETSRDTGGEATADALRDAGGEVLASRDAAKDATVDQAPDVAPKDAGGGRELGPDLPEKNLPLGAPCTSSAQCGTNTTCTSGVCCASQSCEGGCMTGCSSAGACMICATCTCMPATGTCHC